MRRPAGLLMACVLLAGCTVPASDVSAGDAATGTSRVAPAPSAAGVDVDTAALRRQKRAASVQPCPRSASGASNDLPAVTLPCLGGGPDVDLTALRGPLVVNLFATWCGPCREELPHFATLHDRAGGAVRVLGVNYGDPYPAEALGMAATAGVTYPLVADPGERLRTPLRVRGLPGVVFVRRDGTVAATQYRVFRSYAELRDAVRTTLGVRVPS